MEHSSRHEAFRYDPSRMPFGGQSVLTKHVHVNCGTTVLVLDDLGAEAEQHA